MQTSDSPPPDRPTPSSLESTQVLLAKIRHGDDSARNRLVARFLPALQRWARGRVPQGALDLVETDDLVQVTLLRALARADEFEPGREGAFLSYLHTILLNCVRDQARRANRRSDHRPLTESVEGTPAPPRAAATQGAISSYERALGALPDELQQAVILRVEFGCSYAEIGRGVGASVARRGAHADRARPRAHRGVDG